MSLSIGAEFVDPNDRPNLEARLRATIADSPHGTTVVFPDDIDHALVTREACVAWDEVAKVEDARLCDMTPHLHILPVDEFVTVTSADLAPAGNAGFFAAEGRVIRELHAAVDALRPGESASLTLTRAPDGTLSLRVTR
jgi:hypothetical protein